jgi:uncharacterized protein (DUF1330 family)
MPAYFVIDLTVFDAEKIKEYEKGASLLVARYGGRFLTHGKTCDAIEGEWRPQHLLIEEYRDRQTIHTMFNDPDNEPLKGIRRSGSIAHALAVDGLSD